jgi:cell division protein FtsB
MIFGYFTLFVALLIEVVGAYYSITGLAAIFSGAVVPILIMGGSLEVGKVTAAVWLKNNWHRASLQFKLYLLPAVTLLMFITSMGIFGFLSKAHNDQNLVSGDVQSKISIYDEKIKTAKENIEADRKQIKQMDDAVDQVMARSTTEGGADKSNAIRRSQAKDRASLAKDIEANQKIISQLNDEAAPIRAEVRKVEAEVGPIKYIAKLIYGDNPDANILEKAVVWVIMMIVAVFDPLALVLILAAQQSIRWAQGKDQEEEKEETPVVEESYTSPLENLEPVVDELEIPEDYYKDPEPEEELPVKKPRWAGFGFPLPSLFTKKEEPVVDDQIDDDEHEIDELEKQARRNWKEAHPGETIKKHRRMFESGLINDLPWMHPDYHPAPTTEQPNLGLEVDNAPAGHAGEVKGFGTSFPSAPAKGDMFLRVDQLPTGLYKFNGTNWIEVDKELSDQHAYDTAYIDHLIKKLSTGEYDPDLLSNAERDSIEQRLKK